MVRIRYVDEIGADGWEDVSPYRGQNANMHMTEAMLCAFEATADAKYLDRARSLAHRICVGLASQAEGDLVHHSPRPALPPHTHTFSLCVGCHTHTHTHTHTHAHAHTHKRTFVRYGSTSARTGPLTTNSTWTTSNT